MVEARDALSLQEVAQELGRSLEQVRRYVREGKLPAWKLGMQWFVSRRTLQAFKAAGGKPAEEDDLARAREIREGIRQRRGYIDVAELLEDSRRSHP